MKAIGLQKRIKFIFILIISFIYLLMNFNYKNNSFKNDVL